MPSAKRTAARRLNLFTRFRIHPQMPAKASDLRGWMATLEPLEFRLILKRAKALLSSKDCPEDILDVLDFLVSEGGPVLNPCHVGTIRLRDRARATLGARRHPSTNLFGTTAYPPRKPNSQLRKTGKGNCTQIGGFAALSAVEAAFKVRSSPATNDVRLRNMPEIIIVDGAGPSILFSFEQAEHFRMRDLMAIGDEQARIYAAHRLAALGSSGTRRRLAKAPTLKQIADLKCRFPNAFEVIAHIERAAALARLTPNLGFLFPPLLIAGEPGIGKSAVIKAVAEACSADYQRIDIATISTGSELSGTSLHWATGKTGLVFNTLLNSGVINPVILLDEIDKARGHENSPVLPVLLSLLEPVTAHAFRDEALPLPINASQILWMATANDLSVIPDPLLNRFTVVTMHPPVGEAAFTVAKEIYSSMRASSSWGDRFSPELTPDVLQVLSHLVPRGMGRALFAAVGAAALDGRTSIRTSDLTDAATDRPRSTIGFH